MPRSPGLGRAWGGGGGEGRKRRGLLGRAEPSRVGPGRGRGGRAEARGAPPVVPRFPRPRPRGRAGGCRRPSAAQPSPGAAELGVGGRCVWGCVRVFFIFGVVLGGCGPAREGGAGLVGGGLGESRKLLASPRGWRVEVWGAPPPRLPSTPSILRGRDLPEHP